MMKKAFLTGSRAYGTPNPRSDLDVVVRLSRDETEALIDSGVVDKFYRYTKEESSSLRFGLLNLICVHSDQMFAVWAEGTAHLLTKAPVTRDEAIAHFNKMGIAPSFNSSGADPEPQEKVVKATDDAESFPF